jgi:hypothetical protein
VSVNGRSICGEHNRSVRQIAAWLFGLASERTLEVMNCAAVRGVLAMGCLASVAAGCLPSLEQTDTGPLMETFAVSDYFSPSGYMGDGMSFGQLQGQVNQGCKKRPEGARGNCYVFTYWTTPDNKNPWAGVYWVFPSNNWGSIGGRAVDTTKFQQVRFSAAVEGPTPYVDKMGGDGFLSTFAGKLDPMGHFNTLGETTIPGISDHIDAFALNRDEQVGPEVGAEMKTFHLPITQDVRGWNCSNPKAQCVNGVANSVIGGFGFSIPYPATTDPSGKTIVKIFLDDIVWDTEPPPPS